MAKTHKIPFSKMHGAGNDFVIINQIDHDYNLSGQQIRKFSNRNFGIGFDQLLIIEKSTHSNAEFKYRIFNADGEEVNQCGNGARCFFHYLRLKELTKNNKLLVETRSGLIELSYKENKLIAVDMGKPIFENNLIPFKPNQSTNNIITVNNQEYKFYPVSMGNPHAVIKLNTFDNINLISIGKALQDSLMFPDSVNVNFLRIIDSQNLTLKVYERGSGMTLACGSGACASAVIAMENKWTKGPINISMDGGILKVNKKPNGNIELIGPAKFIFDGEINLNDYLSDEQ
jgi:diaminopimelate epimerase